MSYVTFVALMLLVVSPVLIPLIITGVHAISDLQISTRSVAREQ